MKVALFAYAGVDRSWSLGRLTYLFYTGLNSLGVDTYLVSKYNINQSGLKYIKIKRYPKIGKKDILTDVFSTYSTVKKLKPNVYHLLYPHVSSLLSLPFPSSYSKVLTIHDLKPLIVKEFLDRKEKTNISILKFSLMFIDRVIAISRSTKEQIVQLLGVDEDKVSVVYNPLDPIFRKLNEDEIVDIRQKYGKFIFNLSRFDKLKNPVNLIKSFKYIASCDDNIRLLIVGAFWHYGKSLIENELGKYKDRVDIIERIENETLVKIYNASEAFLFPSIYEGFGMPIIEAMACGTPVITSNRWSMKELAEGVGELVEPEDPVDIAEKTCKVISDKGYRDQLVKKGLEKAKQFNYLDLSKELLNVYEITVGKK
ncbi:glycosyltransferase family 4 protein [Stygiolobus caldivivus]|uniref:Glycosyl transferase n=1 Tax=Stygiolobus caldivivus TaxID=2824673 RepID=A0A8D5ZDE0_9CREN|nr:glycosyltransferase family 1 protein [Stygiolobus caldivivus]BCU69058.1 glycosyl transferase [Stygiolobus caldivivus]